MRFRGSGVRAWVTAAVPALVAVGDLAGQTVPPRPGDDLLGLWGVEATLGPQVRGALVLERVEGRWNMRVGGFEVTTVQTADSVVLAIPGGSGSLRLWVRGSALAGFWVQPPEGDAPSYATPVRFRRVGAQMWTAVVAPLELQFPLYLSIVRDTDGALRGTFRNPAVNWPGRAVYRVERNEETVAFVQPSTGRVQWRQPYDSAQRAITFDFGAPVVLHPRTVEQAVGFVPRSPSLPPYRYRTPVALDDGWSVAPADHVALDAPALERIVRTIVATDPLSDSAPRVHSLLVLRRGRLVLDEYFRGSHAADLHDLRSASKTVTSIMAGVLVQRGAALSPSTRLAGTSITLAHLLSHTSGLACNDDDDASPGNEDRMQSQRAQLDWYAFFAALPVLHAPGTTYAYCSAGVNAAGGMLARTAGQWLPRVFDDALARPMHFGPYAMNLMPTGEAYSGGGLHMRSRDFLKFGALYLNGGMWHGRRLVPASWVTQSTAHQIDRDDGSDDGLGWHRHVLTVGNRRHQTYEASGNGGQFLVVIPDLDMAVVVTAGNYGQYGVWRRIREQLVPAVMAAAR